MRGHVFLDGEQRCPVHATEADRQLLDELDTRAPGVGLQRCGGGWDDAYAWPYGPNVHLAARIRMLDWAEGHGLQLSPRATRCIQWLRTGGCRGSRSCRIHRFAQERSAWLDHVTTWTRNGVPALLVAQPYKLGPDDLDDLGSLDADPQLRLEVSDDAWYGFGTWFVGVWKQGA